MTNDPSSHAQEDADLVARHENAALQKSASDVLSPWLLVVFLLLTFLSAAYFFSNSGGFQANVFNPSRSSKEDASGGAPPDPMVVGKKVFNQTCAVCHQANGQGLPGQFPPLAGSEWVLSKDWHGDNHIVKIVLNGLQGPVTVEGKQFNSAMAPWGGLLKDDQIAAVLTYVRNEWGNQAPPITKEFVAKIREQTKDRTEPWTQKDLQAIERVLISEAAPAPAPEGAPAPQP